MSNFSDPSGRAMSFSAPARALRAVVPDNNRDLPDGTARALFVGSAGPVTVLDATGARATIVSAAHQYHPIFVQRVLADGTTATGILALY